MDEKDIQKEIVNLRKSLTIYESNKLSEILTIVLISIAFVGGGLILGAIFKSVPLFIIVSIFASIPLLSMKIKELDEINLNIKSTGSKIAIYSEEIKKLKALKKTLENPLAKKKIAGKSKLKTKDTKTEKSKANKNSRKKS